jgi:photosystem II stability/assembly factor-like uncharacterized protein
MKKIYSLIIISNLGILGLFVTGDIHSNRLKHNHHESENFESTGPDEWMAQQRAYPHGKIKPESYLEAMHEAAILHAASPQPRSGWQFLGPTNIGGRISDIEVPGNDASTIYIGAATGGILKSTDNGLTWNNIFNHAEVISIGDLAIDPNNNNVIYAGTGEANAASYSFLGNGIYKSIDAGATWMYLGLSNSAYIGRVIVDNSNSQRVFAAVCGNLFTPGPDRGIYRSDDGGLSWSRKLFVTDSTSGIDIVQNPTYPLILYAAMWERMRGLNYRRSFGYSSGIYKSTDGGDTWTKLGNGLPPGYAFGRIGLAIAPSNPDIIYAFCDNEYSVDVFRSNNGGSSWVQVSDSPLQGMNSNFGWYFGQVRVDPVNANRIYVLGMDMYRSDDAGNSWTQLAGYFNYDEIHVDHHAMIIDPISGRILEGNDGGLYVSYSNGDSWQKINNLPLTQFYDIEIDQQKPERIYGGTQDNNTIRTLTDATDDWEAIYGGDGFYSLVDYTNSNVIYAESQWGNLGKSTDGGYSWTSMVDDMSGDRKNWSAPVVMDAQNHLVLYFGTYRVWKTINGGNSWQPVSPDLTKGSDGSTWHTVSTLAISPVNPEIVLAGTDDGKVHISKDAGDNWTDITSGLPDRTVTRVAADPFNENVIYATVSGFRWDEPLPHVYRSPDQGNTWVDISGNLPDLPVNVIALDPDMPDHYFVGTDAGVYYSTDGGSRWWGLGDGLGNVAVTAMKVHNPTRSLIVGTYGLSAYKIDLDGINVGISNVPEHGQKLKLQVSPNPVILSQCTRVNINFSVAVAGKVQIRISDCNGKIINRLLPGTLDKGQHLIQWNGCSNTGAPLTEGIYFINLYTQEGNLQTKLLLLN